MIKRVIEIGNSAYCSVNNNQLVIRTHEREGTIPLEDIGVLILDCQQSRYTHSVLAKCIAHNTALIVCNEKHTPAGMFFPFSSNSTQAKYMQMQLTVPLPTKKRLWQSIVRAKLRAQALVLSLNGVSSSRLELLAGKVRSGDPDNYEAQGAQYYWRALFGSSFRRRTQGDGINALLNYGYAVVRAALARALTASGLHPSFGIHHHNQYNAYCLVDDLIEPLRPIVDNTIAKINHTHNSLLLSSEIKRDILEILSSKVTVERRSYPLMVALSRYTASLRKVYAKEQQKLSIPVM